MFSKIYILGIGVTNATSREVLEFLIKGLKNSTQKMYVVTPNPEIIVKGQHDNEYKKILNDAALALPDGIGVIWAGKILGKKFKEKLTGVDTVKNLCKEAVNWGFTVGFLGGGPKVAEKTSECLLQQYPNLKIVFTGDRWNFFPKDAPAIDILFVAFGAPKQEIWIKSNLPRIPIKLAMGVGGAFDYISGQVPRAPKWIQDIGFEWLFRLIGEPWRVKRQLALIEFIYLVLGERLGYYKNNA